MRSVLIALCLASLTACDGLSMSQKKPGEAQAAAPAATSVKLPEAPEAKPDPDGILAARVKQTLEREAKALAGGIDVTATEGVVTLWGTTASDVARGRAAKIASGVEGVKGVENRITVVKGS
jgi:osmotically-inducible protein OsmY